MTDYEARKSMQVAQAILDAIRSFEDDHEGYVPLSTITHGFDIARARATRAPGHSTLPEGEDA